MSRSKPNNGISVSKKEEYYSVMGSTYQSTDEFITFTILERENANKRRTKCSIKYVVWYAKYITYIHTNSIP